MSPRKVNILAVDDDIRMQRLLQMVMETEGYNVLTAGNGKDALDSLFGEAKVDLVMLDIALPDMDGCDVCRRIREISQVPIIMVTAKDNDSEKVAGFNAGADDYVTSRSRRRSWWPEPRPCCAAPASPMIMPTARPSASATWR